MLLVARCAIFLALVALAAFVPTRAATTPPPADTLAGPSTTSTGIVSNSASRDPATVRAFRRLHPCEQGPDKGSKARCAGFVVDHIKPLCFGGLDAVENMQYQTLADSLKKDAFEREACALARKCAPSK